MTGRMGDINMNMIGLIFSNIHDAKMGELTKQRTLASVPFGGRYRLVDFVLSNMVNSDITTIGVITKQNYQSLMDHLGSCEEWDLNRKDGGLFILPPSEKARPAFTAASWKLFTAPKSFWPGPKANMCCSATATSSATLITAWR